MVSSEIIQRRAQAPGRGGRNASEYASVPENGRIHFQLKEYFE